MANKTTEEEITIIKSGPTISMDWKTFFIILFLIIVASDTVLKINNKKAFGFLGVSILETK